MNLPFLKKIAEKNPALARLIELSIYSVAIYVVSAIANNDVLNSQALIQAGLVPVLAYMSKVGRDLEKMNSK